MKALFRLTLVVACLLGVTVDSVIIREWRDKASLKYPNGTEEANGADGKNPRQRARRPKTFSPSTDRCCKVGYKVAKRGLSCNVDVLAVVRKVNDMQRAKLMYQSSSSASSAQYLARKSKISAKLSNKLGKCSASFSKFFEKCCTYKEKFYSSMKKCKKRTSRLERRRCRQAVRRRYRAPERKRKRKNGKKKKQKQQQQQHAGKERKAKASSRGKKG